MKRLSPVLLKALRLAMRDAWEEGYSMGLAIGTRRMQSYDDGGPRFAVNPYEEPA